MKNFKKFLTLTVCVMMVFAFASCGNTAPAEEEGQEGDPLALVNIEDNGDVTFHCTVNGDWLTGNEAGNVTTRHFIVAEDGFNKGKSVLSGLAPARDIYEAMMEAGLEADGEKEAIERVINALADKGKPDQYLVAMKYLETMKEITSGKDNKVVYMPYEATGILSSVDGIKEMFKGTCK